MIYNSDLLLANIQPDVIPTIIRSDDLLSLENICLRTGIMKTTNNIENATVFCINIMLYVTFSEVINFDDVFTSEIKNKINSTAKLVIYHSHECHNMYNNNYSRRVWDKIIGKLMASGIDTSRVVFVSGDVFIENRKQRNTDLFTVIGLDIFEYFYNIQIKDGEIIPQQNIFSIDKQYDFLFLNSVPRVQRCILKYFLEEHGLLDRAIWSWVIADESVDTHWIKEFTKDNNIREKFDDIVATSSKQKLLDVSRDRLIAEQYQAYLNKEWTDNTIFNLITETNIIPGTMFITEKTYKSIFFSHPFMLYANPGMISYLHTRGYETFPEMFDETYDTAAGMKKINLFINNIKTFKDNVSGKESIINEKLRHNVAVFTTHKYATELKQKLEQITCAL